MAFEDASRQRLAGGRVAESAAISIKVRPADGCFDCPSCNPHAAASISKIINETYGETRFRIERHETGPEVIAYVGLGTAVIAAAAAVLGVVTAMINLRAAGQKQGDKSTQPIELIVRGFDLNGKLFEEKILKLDHEQESDRRVIAAALTASLKRHLMTPKSARRQSASPSKPKPSPQPKPAVKLKKVVKTKKGVSKVVKRRKPGRA